MFNTLEQIRKVYTDEEIVAMLNSHVKNVNYRADYMRRRNNEKKAKLRAYDEWVKTGRNPLATEVQ